MIAGNGRAGGGGKPATRRASVAAGVARSLFSFAVARGAPGEQLLARSGIDAADLEDQDNRIAFEKYVSLMRVSKELCGDPALALHFGEAFDMSEISVVGLIGKSCETLAEGFAQLNRYARLVVEYDLTTDNRFEMLPDDRGFWVVDTRPDPNDFPEFTESTFARMASSSSRLGAASLIREVRVTHGEPAYRSEYARIFSAPVRFDSDRNALLMDSALMSYRNPDASRYVFGILSAHAEKLLEELEKASSTRGRVESLLAPILHTGDANMELIATKMGVTRQTLFRKLKSEGVTFERLLDDLRRRMALRYLQGRNVSVNETAYLVGFSEPAAFSRAFKRWTGASPRAFLRVERSAEAHD